MGSARRELPPETTVSSWPNRAGNGKPTGLVVYAADVQSLVVGEEGIALDGDWRGVRVADRGGGSFGERRSEGGRDQRRREKKSGGALHDCQTERRRSGICKAREVTE